MLWYFMLAFSTHNSSFDFTNNQFYIGMYIKKGYKIKLNPKNVQLDCCMGVLHQNATNWNSMWAIHSADNIAATEITVYFLEPFKF